MVATYNSTDVARSRYVQGGITDRYPTRLGWWDRRVFTRSDSDIRVTINVRYEYRPWLVAYDIYGSEQLEWLVLQYNGILDVNEEFTQGKVLVLPTPQRLNFEILSNGTGGKNATES